MPRVQLGVALSGVCPGPVVRSRAREVERTSPRVGRRDPLGVGLRPGCEPVSRFVASRSPGVPTDCSAVERKELARALLRARAACERPAEPVVRTCPPRASRRCRLVDFSGSRLLLSAALKAGRPTRPVLKHGPRSLTCARVIGSH